MIIAIGGRKESGKTELVKLLTKRKYIKISFATKLKQIICDLYGIENIDKLNELKEVPMKLDWSYKMKDLFCDLADISKDDFYIFDNKYKRTSFSGVRDALQYLGTDILRNIDINYHVKATLNHLDKSKNYCIDDIRFHSEMEGVKKEVSGDFSSYYILRPDNFSISNHQSERELSWKDFDNVILNTGTIKDLENKFNSIYINGIDIDLNVPKNDLFYDITSENEKLFKKVFDCMNIDAEEKFYEICIEDKESEEYRDLMKLEDSDIKYKHTTGQKIYSITNPYLVENIKKWIEPEIGFIDDVDILIRKTFFDLF